MALRVNDERVGDEVIRREAEAMRARLQQMSPEEREHHGFDPVEMEKHLWDWAKENVIERTLLRQEAEKDNEPTPPEEVDKAIEDIKKRQPRNEDFQGHGGTDEIRREIESRIRLDRLLGKITRDIKPPKKKDIADYYRKRKDQFRLPDMVHAAHIVKHTGDGVSEAAALGAIKQVQQELEAGGMFEELADRYSDCPGNGGDLGRFPRGKMVEEFDDVVFSLGQGKVSPIFQTVFGFHIAKVYEHTPARFRPLTEVQEEIEAQLYREKETKAVERFVDALRAKANVEEVPSGEAMVGRGV